MNNELIEINDNVKEKLESFKKGKLASDIWSYCETIEKALDRLEILEERYSKDLEVLFDTCLVSIQHDETDKSVKNCKNSLIKNISRAILYQHDKDYDLKRLHELAEKHNKKRKYNDNIFNIK